MARRVRIAFFLAGVLVLGYAGVCAAMFLNQASFVYFPERAYAASPRDFGLPFEDVRLRASDGTVLAAWWIPAEGARGAVVLAHGNGGNMSHRLDKARLLHDLGWSVLLFDYRGYGASDGEPSEEGTYTDMAAAADHVLSARGVDAARLVLYGESLGGAVAIEAACRRYPGALVVDSSFTGLREMARHYYPWLPASLLRYRYDSLSRMPSLRCPVMVLHSPQDDIVPYTMGRALFDAAPEPKRFAELAGGHNDGGLMASPGAQRELGAFLREVISEK
jgi:uncharacterized protein